MPDDAIDALNDAIEDLQRARRAAGSGTSMRIDGLIERVRRVRNDTEEIHEDGS